MLREENDSHMLSCCDTITKVGTKLEKIVMGMGAQGHKMSESEQSSTGSEKNKSRERDIREKKQEGGCWTTR